VDGQNLVRRGRKERQASVLKKSFQKRKVI
jgi:hypothetical protein